MFARVTTYKIKPGTADQMQYLTEQNIVPWLQIRKGFKALDMVQTSDTEVIAFEAWESRESADAVRAELEHKIKDIFGKLLARAPSTTEGKLIVHETGPEHLHNAGIRVMR